jgi:hypothetical protein
MRRNPGWQEKVFLGSFLSQLSESQNKKATETILYLILKIKVILHRL